MNAQFRLKQLINKPTYLTRNSSSLIDLIFQPKLVMESGVNSPLHKNCHHQTIYAKFKIYYLTAAERESGIIKKRT